MQVFGPNSAQLVPAYLLLGESSIGLNQLAQAEDYLSLAKWALMKKRAAKKRDLQPGSSPAHNIADDSDPDGGRDTAPAEGDAAGGEGDEDHEVLALLNRNFGLLYLKKGRTDEAIRYFALDNHYGAFQIYHSSIAKNDPEDLSDEAQQAEGVQILTAITVATANEPVPAAAKRAGATAQHALALLLARDGGSQEKARAAAEKAVQMDPKAAETDTALKELAAA
ncbi:Zinc finger MYND domain-containing protein 12 [Geranomyces michiganensis]|nr:Zinc finger MYND domain-containing protein 12 [Geranomyces michiganensis]